MESNLLCDASKSRSFSWECMTMLIHKVKWISGHWSILLFLSVRCFGLQIKYVNTISIPLLQKKQVMFAAYQIWLWLDWMSSSVWKWLSACWLCVHRRGRTFPVYLKNGSFFVSPLSVCNAQIGHRRLAIPCCLWGAFLCCYWDGIRWAGTMLPSCEPQRAQILKLGFNPTTVSNHTFA